VPKSGQDQVAFQEGNRFDEMIKKVEGFMANPKSSLKRLHFQSGLFRGRSDYKRFIVLSRSRTGSNMLISMLNSHPFIYAEGEIFRSLRGRSVQEILDRIYSKYPRYISAVGFKIFYYHPQDDKSGMIWKALEEMGDLCIIHLKRRNILRTLVSRKLAGFSGAYKFSQNSTRETTKKVCQFGEQELLEGFEQTRRWETSFETRFYRTTLMNLYYEDLVNKREEEFNRITSMLGIVRHSPRTSLRRQNPERLCHLIENYNTMKERFENTEWAEFFED
jgi:LPS sulfotransferase NodH